MHRRCFPCLVSPAGLSILLLLAILACNTPATKPIEGEEAVATNEILWDTAGVPHIFVRNSEKLAFALGWAQARRHGTLVLRLFGQARGEDITARADAWLGAQERNLRTDLDAFARGINAYYSTNPQDLDPAVATVLPVAARDVVTHLEQARHPHQPGSAYLTGFDVHIVSPTADVYGIALVGMPFIGKAWQDGGGWTLTLDAQSTADLRLIVQEEDRDALATALQQIGEPLDNASGQAPSPGWRSRADIEANLARRELM